MFLFIYFSLRLKNRQILDVSGGQHPKFQESKSLTLSVGHLDPAHFVSLEAGGIKSCCCSQTALKKTRQEKLLELKTATVAASNGISVDAVTIPFFIF